MSERKNKNDGANNKILQRIALIKRLRIEKETHGAPFYSQNLRNVLRSIGEQLLEQTYNDLQKHQDQLCDIEPGDAQTVLSWDEVKRTLGSSMVAQIKGDLG